MTKEEVMKKHTVTKIINGKLVITNDYEAAMQEYADQETERLKAEIEYLLTENKMLKQALDESDRKLIICEDTCDIHEQSLKELNKLKEKHKRDVVEAIIDNLYDDGDDDIQQEINERLANKYYKQKFE